MKTLYEKFVKATKGFTPGLCNDKVVQDITFSVPEMLEYVEILEGLQKLVPNKNFDAEDQIPETSWYTRIASVEDLMMMSTEQRIDLQEKLKLQSTFWGVLSKPSNMFKVWDGVRYNFEEIEKLKQFVG